MANNIEFGGATGSAEQVAGRIIQLEQAVGNVSIVADQILPAVETVA